MFHKNQFFLLPFAAVQTFMISIQGNVFYKRFFFSIPYTAAEQTVHGTALDNISMLILKSLPLTSNDQYNIHLFRM